MRKCFVDESQYRDRGALLRPSALNLYTRRVIETSDDF